MIALHYTACNTDMWENILWEICWRLLEINFLQLVVHIIAPELIKWTSANDCLEDKKNPQTRVKICMEDFLCSMDSSIFTAFIETNHYLKQKKKCNEEFNLLVCDMLLK